MRFIALLQYRLNNFNNLWALWAKLVTNYTDKALILIKCFYNK